MFTAPIDLCRNTTRRGVHVDDVRKTATFLDDVKEWSGPFFDAHQLGVRLNFDADVKMLLSTSKF